MPSALPRSIRLPARALGALVVGAACLWGAPAALADSTSSGNWAGYAAHRAGVHFRTASARWRVPTGSCTSGNPTYSSIWVGLGGYSRSSNALEQTGTELDCTRDGQVVYSAWYELVPAPAQAISLGVRGGDLMQAVVTVVGHRVTISLQDLTIHQSFHRTFYASQVDTTSADWIVEAPSACDSGANCFTLPLADFGNAAITAAHAVTQGGHGGSVTSHWWGVTEITLAPHATRFFAGTADSAGAEANPSSLASGGSAFSVTYQASASGTGSTTPVGQTGPGGPPGPSFSGHLVHPRR